GAQRRPMVRGALVQDARPKRASRSPGRLPGACDPKISEGREPWSTTPVIRAWGARHDQRPFYVRTARERSDRSSYRGGSFAHDPGSSYSVGDYGPPRGAPDATALAL